MPYKSGDIITLRQDQLHDISFGRACHASKMKFKVSPPVLSGGTIIPMPSSKEQTEVFEKHYYGGAQKLNDQIKKGGFGFSDSSLNMYFKLAEVKKIKVSDLVD